MPETHLVKTARTKKSRVNLVGTVCGAVSYGRHRATLRWENSLVAPMMKTSERFCQHCTTPDAVHALFLAFMPSISVCACVSTPHRMGHITTYQDLVEDTVTGASSVTASSTTRLGDRVELIEERRKAQRHEPCRRRHGRWPQTRRTTW
jgi:hypothetical protein